MRARSRRSRILSAESLCRLMNGELRRAPCCFIATTMGLPTKSIGYTGLTHPSRPLDRVVVSSMSLRR